MLRLLLKYYIRWRVRQYLAFFDGTDIFLGKFNSTRRCQSNMNIAKARFMKARLMYWQSQFEPWGDWYIGGKGSCVGHPFLYKEMVWLGFTREIRTKEWDIVKNEEYPDTINYYPTESTGYYKNVAYPLNYREIINKETGTFENYEIPKEWRKKIKNDEN